MMMMMMMLITSDVLQHKRIDHILSITSPSDNPMPSVNSGLYIACINFSYIYFMYSTLS